MLARDDRFSRGIIAILSGTVLSRLIAFAAIPVLSRLFTPSDFGVFALLSMVIAVLGPVATWRYEAAIILPDDEDDAVNLLLVSCIFRLPSVGALAALVEFLYLVCRHVYVTAAVEVA
jgi:O-antigen/teichoic acid export membrane protein